MTEEEWLTTRYPQRLLDALPVLIKRRSRVWWDRKYRLFGCACFRAVWDILPDEVLHAAVVTAEKYADGAYGKRDLAEAEEAIIRQSHWLKSIYVEGCIQLLRRTARKAAESRCYSGRWGKSDPALSPIERGQNARREEDRLQDVHRDFLRDIFGNPFRPVALAPEWRTDTAVALARQMYDSRDFGAMPILADALQDAGCEDAEVLNHCREASQIHIRGCWVVDLVLGKE